MLKLSCIEKAVEIATRRDIAMTRVDRGCDVVVLETKGAASRLSRSSLGAKKRGGRRAALKDGPYIIRSGGLLLGRRGRRGGLGITQARKATRSRTAEVMAYTTGAGLMP